MTDSAGAALYDVVHMGRSSIDLYATDVGADFAEVTSFAAYVGGSPTNISVGGRRLGLRTALLTAVGEDPVGDFVLKFLREEGVETSFVARKRGFRTSAVLLGVQPPDRFPLVYYRERCADLQLDIDDVLAAPLSESRAFQFAGTNLSREPSRTATLFAAEAARRGGCQVMLDIDFRPDQWDDPRAFGVTLRSALRLVDLVVGTEDELNALMLAEAAQVQLAHSQVSDARVTGDAATAVEGILELGPSAVIEKRGPDGARIHLAGDGGRDAVDVPGFPVEVVNILGAGDAFAAGLLYGLLHQWDWRRAVRLANACGAIVVTRHGCANFMPTYAQAMEFAEQHGGL